MYYVPLPIPKELLRLFVEHLWGSDPPVRLHIHRKHNTGICMCIHMRYAGFEPAIPVDSVNIFPVYYSQNTPPDWNSLSDNTSQLAANKYRDVPPASIPRFRLFTR